MRKRIAPSPGTPAARFLDVLLHQTMYAHPEFLQEVGNRRMQELVESLRDLGYLVEMKEMSQPTLDRPDRVVALFYIGDQACDMAIGEDIDA
jgi:hypothetical protein